MVERHLAKVDVAGSSPVSRFFLLVKFMNKKHSHAKAGSGFVHTHYGHKHRPVLLHVICPTCSHEAMAFKLSEKGLGEHIMDLSGTMEIDDWQVRCSHCGNLKKNISYTSLPPLYYRTQARHQEIWGWNRDHFLMLLKVMEGKSLAGDKYAFFKNYVRGEWLRGSIKKALAKAMREKLE